MISPAPAAFIHIPALSSVVRLVTSIILYFDHTVDNRMPVGRRGTVPNMQRVFNTVAINEAYEFTVMANVAKAGMSLIHIVEVY